MFRAPLGAPMCTYSAQGTVVCPSAASQQAQAQQQQRAAQAPTPMYASPGGPSETRPPAVPTFPGTA